MWLLDTDYLSILDHPRRLSLGYTVSIKGGIYHVNANH